MKISIQRTLVGRRAFMIMRGQPVHRGHTKHIHYGIMNFDELTVGLGSVGRFDAANPFPFEIRKEMLRNIYGNKVRIVPLDDIGSEQDQNTWCDYVLSKLDKLNIPPPTDYFTGSHADAVWYKGRFWDSANPNPPVDLNPSYWLDGMTAEQRSQTTPRLLHILDRSTNPVPSATELRTYMATRNDGWKPWVPRVNHYLVEQHFPEEFKIAP